jgi:molybdenum-dependent DNA-binding transcriptional regulator ModE
VTAALSDEQIEQLHIEYAQLGQVSKAARAVGVSWSSAKRYLKQELIDPTSELAITRERKKIGLAETLGEAAIVLAQAMADKTKISEARLQEIAVSLGIAIEKLQLITGQATERYEHRDIDEPRQSLAGRVDELARRRRSKDADQRTRAVGS